MIMQDDRTDAEKLTHTTLIAGTDSFMSGWGQAEGGKSIAVWACEEGELSRVLSWADQRSDMKRVRRVYDPYKPHGEGHCHIYVVRFGHVALGSHDWQESRRQAQMA